jgi:hypothetical protein
VSNIPEARSLLKGAQEGSWSYRWAVEKALPLLDRKKPTFVARKSIPKLSEGDKAFCIDLRAKGLSMNAIARRMHTNLGRVSEAINA